MSKIITAKFSDIDSLDRAARLLKKTPLSKRMEILSVELVDDPKYNDDFPDLFAVPFGGAGQAPFYNDPINSAAPFDGLYGAVMASGSEHRTNRNSHSREAQMKLRCADVCAGELHGRLIALGAYEIKIV